MTGASGRIGRLLVEHLSLTHEVITFGRSNSDYLWTLGIIPTESQLKDINLIIHLGWSLRDRSADFHLNVGGTLLLAQAAHKSKIPFLFISSVAAASTSEYGKSKAEAEILVLDCLGTVVRIGLVPQSNRYEESRKRYLTFYPNFKFKIQTTSIGLLYKTIDEWISQSRIGSISDTLKTVVSTETDAKSVFSSTSKFMLPIPLIFIKFILSICKPFSLKARNLGDALLSVTTIGRQASGYETN